MNRRHIEPTVLGARFWSKVSKGDPDACWNWRGALSDGYGMFWWQGKTVAAHRLAYESHVGPVPSGFEIDHVCTNRRCVNPAHLRSLAHRQNCNRRYSELQVCPHGHVYSEANTLWLARDNHGGVNRKCRTCNRNRARAAKAKAAALNPKPKGLSDTEKIRQRRAGRRARGLPY
jgi:HNH endonuclease